MYNEPIEGQEEEPVDGEGVLIFLLASVLILITLGAALAIWGSLA